MAKKKNEKKDKKKVEEQAADALLTEDFVDLTGDSGECSLVPLDGRIVEATGEEEFADLRKAVFNSRKLIDRSRWDLAAALYEIKEKNVYERWGYYSWDEYVKNEVGMTVRTTQYLISMYHCFYVEIGSELDDDKKQDLASKVSEIGWTKARSLVGVVDKENVDDWIDKAKDMSSAELEGVTKRALLEQNGEDSSAVESVSVVSIRFYDEQREVYEQALGLAKEIADSDKKNHLLSLICQDFVTTNMVNRGGSVGRLGRYLDRTAAILGIKIVAVDNDSGKVVHGKGLLDSLSTDADNVVTDVIEVDDDS